MVFTERSTFHYLRQTQIFLVLLLKAFICFFFPFQSNFKKNCVSLAFPELLPAGLYSSLLAIISWSSSLCLSHCRMEKKPLTCGWAPLTIFPEILSFLPTRRQHDTLEEQRGPQLAGEAGAWVSALAGSHPVLDSTSAVRDTPRSLTNSIVSPDHTFFFRII